MDIAAVDEDDCSYPDRGSHAAVKHFAATSTEYQPDRIRLFRRIEYVKADTRRKQHETEHA